MKAYIEKFTKSYDYPTEATKTILDAYDVLKSDKRFNELLDNYYTDEAITKEVFLEDIKKVSEDTGVNYSVTCLTFFVCLTPKLKEEYKKAGIADDVAYDTIEDLKFKLFECYDLHGIWGLEPVSAIGWYYAVFHLKVLAFGRLEFNTNPFRWDYAEVAGRSISKGDVAIYVHIPASGRPFDKESRIDAYDKAYNFFKERYFGDKEPVFCCDTWLLFPENKKLLNEKSNIVSFMDDFKIFHKYTHPLFEDLYLWHVFGADTKKDPHELPRRTSIQKAYADYLAQGNKLGNGVGVFVYDPINRKTVK